jgi:hypothetical protein
MQRENFCNNLWLDSPLHQTAARLDSPVQDAVARFDSPLHNSVERFDSSLHHAAGSQTLIIVTPRIWKQIRKTWLLLMKKKNGGGKAHATVPLIYALYAQTCNVCMSRYVYKDLGLSCNRLRDI